MGLYLYLLYPSSLTNLAQSITSEQAQNHLIQPLLDPQPSEETGLNSHFPSTFAKQQPSSPTTQQPSSPIVLQSNNPFGGANSPRRRSRNLSNPGSPNSPKTPTFQRSRGNSLTERYPGDKSHSPLAMLKEDHAKAAAHKSHHRKRLSDVDQIDALDSVPGGGYHHEGPFDATLASRNMNVMTSPVAAVAESNAAALNATPVEKVRDALERHMPLDGVASVPPGERDGLGRSYDYRETNVMTEDGGDYGKEVRYGEIPKIDHEHDDTGLASPKDGVVSESSAAETSGIELQDRKKKSVDIQAHEVEGESSNHHHSLTEGIKRRIGSLRHKKHPVEE